jgi:hypothetical protein
MAFDSVRTAFSAVDKRLHPPHSSRTPIPMLFSTPLRTACAATCLLTGVLQADSPDAVVTFSEIHYNPPTSQDAEWIELHNQMAVNIDLSGWSLAGGVEFTIPKGTLIGPGQFRVIAKTPAHPSLAGVPNVLGPFTGNLSNSGETIDLLSPTGRLMDRMTYADDDDWPVAADGLGATLAKHRNGTAAGPAENWGPSPLAGGTPGSANNPTADGPVRHPLVTAAASWRFSDAGTAPPAHWNQPGFDDSGWGLGPAPLGSGMDASVLTVTGSLSARYRAGAITGVANGATFTTWADTHTADGFAQSATAGGNPTFRTLVTPTGQSAVRFDGNDEFRTALSPGIGSTSGFVYFIVCRANATPVSGAVNDGAGAYLFDREHLLNGPPLVSLKAVNGRYGLQTRYDDNSGIGGPVSTTPISTSAFQIVAVRRNLTAARFEIWVDGVMEASTPDSGAALTPQPIVIARHATQETGGFNGDIAELLIYRDELAEADFQRVGSYLEARYGLQTGFPDDSVATQLAATPTRYLRHSFPFVGDPANSVLRLSHTVADGAVFYLNGQELARDNLPAGPVAHGTAALSNVVTPVSSGVIQLPPGALSHGDNVLAVSLHSAPADTSGFFAATLEAIESPADPAAQGSLRLNEIAGAADAGFFIEIANAGADPVALENHQLTLSGLNPASFALPATVLAAGGIVSFTSAELGFRPVSGDKIALRSPANAVLDARTATNRLRGRSDAHPGQWLFPATATPGTANQFNFTSDVVISEIAYHPPDLPAVAGTPPVTSTVALLPYTAIWRYNASGANLGTTWAASAHAVGGSWQSGAGIHSYPSNLPVSTGTPLVRPSLNNPFVITYYFETNFTLTEAQAANLSALRWNQLIDDGAVFFLNGTEINRYNLPGGTIAATTLASSAVTTAAVIGPVTVAIPPGVAVAGTNRISVEVHQVSTSSSDIVFGLNLSAIIVTDPGTPDLPARPSAVEWLELHNRGQAAVDLTGWNFSSGITFTMPPGTFLEPGANLVVASDPALHPGRPVVGPYSGSLSRNGETLVLRDAFNNPADRVAYCDGGRWPGAADGGGASLELRDPWADNALPESWAASDETSRQGWQTHTYRGVAAASAVGPDGQWREFVLGLLNSGEILLDDIQVIEDPDGAPISLVAGGNFESGTAGWRFLGNHRDAAVIQDPANPSNKVLHLRATGATEHMHNHVETTLTAGRSIVNGRTYQISFRTRWLRGSNLLNTRLYFNRLAKTTLLSRPLDLGTPGAANSTAQPNIGPGFYEFAHHPVVPAPGEPVTITARVGDPDGIGGLMLHYSVAGAPAVALPMTAGSDGSLFSATLPGQAAATVVRFYVAATDAATPPALAYFPAGGPAAHALYQVDDGLAATNGLHNLRIIMDPADKALLYQTNNLMSNGRLGCTVISDEREVYYDVGVRLKGSQRGRPQPARVGFNLGFNEDQLFRGIHRTVAIDRSEGQITGCQEILYDHLMNAAGGIPAEYNDLVKVIAPDPAHTSAGILQLARYGDTFLDSQFEHGADGTVYEYELIYYPTTTDASGYKVPEPDSVVGTDLTDLGADKENYRWSFITKNNEDADDYSRIIAMSKRFALSGAAFENGIESEIDTDQWLRALAHSCASGAGDSFFANSNHNGQFYARPGDERVLYFPHDMDFSFNATRAIFENAELQKLTAVPARRRAYLGHLHHLCSSLFNQAGMAPWTTHYGSLLPGEDFAGHLSYITTRSNYILNQINSSIAPLTFAITTNGGANFETTASPVVLTGQGWVDVREIRLAGSSVPLPTQWTSNTTWQATVPLAAGTNALVLQAWNLAGEMVGSDSITVTNTGNTQVPGPGTLAVSEIFYNPPGTSEQTEYLELLNTSPTATLDLGGLTFTAGITFTFPSPTELPPAGRILVAKDPLAFAAAYGAGLNVVGGFPDNLSNSGEVITLRRADNVVVQSFAYSDLPPWPVAADGDGYSLTLIDPFSNPDHGDPRNWRASAVSGGSPGLGDTIDYADWKAATGGHDDAEDRDGDGFTTRQEYFLGGDPAVAEQDLAPLFTSEPGGTLLMSVTRRATAADPAMRLEISADLTGWQPDPTAEFLSNQRLGGTPARDRLTFRLTPPPDTSRYFARFAFGP